MVCIMLPHLKKIQKNRQSKCRADLTGMAQFDKLLAGPARVPKPATTQGIGVQSIQSLSTPCPNGATTTKRTKNLHPTTNEAIMEGIRPNLRAQKLPRSTSVLMPDTCVSSSTLAKKAKAVVCVDGYMEVVYQGLVVGAPTTSKSTPI